MRNVKLSIGYFLGGVFLGSMSPYFNHPRAIETVALGFFIMATAHRIYEIAELRRP